MKPTIRNKRENALAYARGDFGVHARQFRTPEEAVAAGAKLVMVRSYLPGSPFCVPNLTPSQARELLDFYVNMGGDPSQCYFCEMFDPCEPSMHGQVFRGPGGLTLGYSTSTARTWREGMVTQKHAEGLKAKLLLEWHMSAPSYDQLLELLDRYADLPCGTSHVVEFTTWPVMIDDEGHNTVYWEVRSY